MTSVKDKPQSPAEKAVQANPSTNPFAKKNKAKAQGATTDDGSPAFFVNIEKTDSRREPGKTYSPEELRAKARSLLQSSKVTPKEREVLAEILGDDSEPV